MTALIRITAESIHPVEIAFFRAITNLVLMVPFVMATGRSLFRTTNHRIYMFRGVVGFTFMMTFFPGAAMIPIADSQTLIFTAPLWATVMAIAFLGERLYRHRAIALAVGFAGAMIILRPGFETASLGAALVFVAALCNATSHVIVTYTTRSDHPDYAVFYLALGRDAPLLSPYMEISAETIPQGESESFRTADPLGLGLAHSAVYDDPEVWKKLADWIDRTVESATCSAA